jgi:hypothetical protein
MKHRGRCLLLERFFFFFLDAVSQGNRLVQNLREIIAGGGSTDRWKSQHKSREGETI